MEPMSDALKYVVQARNLLGLVFDEVTVEEIRILLDKAEEALVKNK